MQAILNSTMNCPECGHNETLTMPTDACVYFHECSGCGVLLKPHPGDCCVFCSYGDIPCPPVQTGGNCCVTQTQ
jgi:hypothetical protein